MRSSCRRVYQFANICVGDGIIDDTDAIEKAIKDSAETGSIVYFESGTYLISDTIEIPSGAKLVGEAWPNLVATGANFQDAQNPRPLIRVGQIGSTGNVEIQGLIFTAKGPLPGLVVVEWNLKAESPGSAALWDCHALLNSQGTSSSAAGQDNSAALMLHVTKKASAYLENMLVSSPGASRGVLVESTAPTWLYGTVSEQAQLYQYNFYEASDVYAG